MAVTIQTIPKFVFGMTVVLTIVKKKTTIAQQKSTKESKEVAVFDTG